MQTLEAKRGTIGLSDDEPSELGHLFAEAAHKPYADADMERRARARRERSQEEQNLPRRWSPFRLRRWARSLEIGQTASLTEDVERYDKDRVDRPRPRGWTMARSGRRPMIGRARCRRR